MITFTDEFKKLMDERFENPYRFCQVTGAANGYVTDIIKGKRLPTIEILNKWLNNAGLPQKNIARMCHLCRIARLRDDPNLAPLLDHFNDRLGHLTDLLVEAISACNSAGLKLPKNLLEAIHSLNRGE